MILYIKKNIIVHCNSYTYVELYQKGGTHQHTAHDSFSPPKLHPQTVLVLQAIY